MPIQCKYSNVSGFVPRRGQLKTGEPFINTADQRIFSADANGTIFMIVAGGAGNPENTPTHSNDEDLLTGED